MHIGDLRNDHANKSSVVDATSSKMHVGMKFKPRVREEREVLLWNPMEERVVIVRALARRKHLADTDRPRSDLECAAPRSVRQDSRIGRYFVSINRRMGTWSNRPSLVGSSGFAGGTIYLISHHEAQYLGRCVLFVEYSTGACEKETLLAALKRPHTNGLLAWPSLINQIKSRLHKTKIRN